MTIAIIIAGVVIFGFVIKVLTNISDAERQHEKKFNEYEAKRQKFKAEMELQHDEIKRRNEELKKRAEAERKAREAAATQAAKQADTQMTFGFEAPVAEPKPVDPNKPKRKSPIKHDVIHHDDNFWLDVCREYQVLKHKNPKLTQTDFVKTKGDPTIKVKTFNEKMRQLAQTGMFIHKPRTNKK